jgi:hypothetical protein
MWGNRISVSACQGSKPRRAIQALATRAPVLPSTTLTAPAAVLNIATQESWKNVSAMRTASCEAGTGRLNDAHKRKVRRFRNIPVHRGINQLWRCSGLKRPVAFSTQTLAGRPSRKV